MPSSDKNRASWLSLLSEKIIYSRFIGWLFNTPPIAYLIRTVLRRSNLMRSIRTPSRSHSFDTPAQEITHNRAAHADLQSTLDAIAIDVVETFNYVGALVATYEPGGALPVRAWYTRPEIATREQVLEWEAEVAALSPNRPISLTNPAIARVYVNDNEYARNLSVQAYREHKPVTSSNLFDLFQPITPESTRPFIETIQSSLGVREVIAVPFFIEPINGDQTTLECVGNLFALKDTPISLEDTTILQAFGRQTAAAILSDRRRVYVEAVLSLISDIQTNFQNEAQILQRIVEGVVQNLNYVGALVATYEPGGALPVRAWYARPEIATREQVLEWEARVAALSPNRPISLTNPDIARVYVNDKDFAGNLSVQAYREKKPVTSSSLFDLFQPVTPESTRPFIETIQSSLGVRAVIAVPFFKGDSSPGQEETEFVGNLFVLSSGDGFNSDELRMLQAFGQQAATGIRNAQLYHRSEGRRQAAEIFGKMAFNASTSVHDLKNKIGIIRGYVDGLIEEPDQADENIKLIFDNLDEIADDLDVLHQPFTRVQSTLVSINACISRAVREVRKHYNSIPIKLTSFQTLPKIYASQDMLSEAFKVLIKNAAEAIDKKGEGGDILITSGIHGSHKIEIAIKDDGTGIKRENLPKIFEMGWSTKDFGLGFGLFWTKDYIEGIGGSLDVRSTYGQGTTFVVTIPIKTADKEET